MKEIVTTFAYCGLGIVLMNLGIFIIDLIIPCNFGEEIKKKNVAVGYIVAGVSVGVSIILKSSIISPVMSNANYTSGEGVIGTVVYFSIGIFACIIGYLAMLLMNKRYNLNKEIGEGNPAAGLMVMGMFVGLSIVISGVIY